MEDLRLDVAHGLRVLDVLRSSIHHRLFLQNVRLPLFHTNFHNFNISSHSISQAPEPAPEAATSISELTIELRNPCRVAHADREKGGSFFNGHLYTINREAPGMPMLRWNNEVLNDGLMCYTHLFNAERVLVTSPKALAEVLVQKNYEFIKPRMFIAGLGQLLGFGILLAEGEEHKVSISTRMLVTSSSKC